jgi:hypothetical protein
VMLGVRQLGKASGFSGSVQFRFKFSAENKGGPQHIVSGFESQKLRTACQSLHLAKIPGMKSISKPRLSIEIYTIC